MIKFPRVLIIYNSRINLEDQYGVSIRGWFSDFPRESLAQIYSGGDEATEALCKSNFKLGPKERRYGRWFYNLKGSSFGQSSYPLKPGENNEEFEKVSFWSLIRSKASTFLLNTGLWELIFRPVISTDLKEFVKEFNPDVIYCQGYSLTFSWLPVMLHNLLHIPISFQTGDDWPYYLYRSTPVSFLVRPIVKNATKSLLMHSSVRLANSKVMAEEYGSRYNLSFEPIMMCDNNERFKKSFQKRLVGSSIISIVYSGSLNIGRCDSIIDLCDAANLLKDKKGIEIMITAFASTISPGAVNVLKKRKNIQILPNPPHNELPAYLKGADVLFLPEAFDLLKAQEISLSISTKAHLYMMSEKPILVYASPLTGIVKYAKEEGWAYVVDERDLNQLAQGLLKLIINNEYARQFVDKGITIALKNHDENKVRDKFRAILQSIEYNY